MKLLNDVVCEEAKKSPGLKVYIHLRIFFGNESHITCPCGRNIEVTGRLRSYKGAVKRRNFEVSGLREMFSKETLVIIKNRNRSSHYSSTKSTYVLIAHVCDLKKCVIG